MTVLLRAKIYRAVSRRSLINNSWAWSGAHRLPEGEALGEVAAELIELGGIRLGLCTFRDDIHAEIVTQCDDRSQYNRPRSLGIRPHKGPVDLDGVERKTLQVGQRGMAGAEVIKREAGAELLDARQDQRRLLRIFHDNRLCDFQLERAAEQAGAREYGAQVVDQVVLEQLA